MEVCDDTDGGESVPMKCRKCRYVLLSHPEVRIEDHHNQPIDLESPSSPAEPEDRNKKLCKSDVWYIPEDCMPDWMTKYVEKGEWLKGKINCPKCDARIGSYNFVSGLRCSCKYQVVAPIHIVKSKVDFTTVPIVPKLPAGSQDIHFQLNTIQNDDASMTHPVDS